MESGCGASLARTCLAMKFSLISGEIQGVLVERPSPAYANPLKYETSTGEFPAVGTGNCLLQTGKDIAASSELRTVCSLRAADIAAPKCASAFDPKPTSKLDGVRLAFWSAN